jgi:hypothetical protein
MTRYTLTYNKSLEAAMKTVEENQTNQEDLYELANLYPRDTGLPMTIWVSPKGNARHDVRIKVCLSPGDRMDAANTAVVGVRPQPRVIAGQLPAQDFAAVGKWITLNTAALVGYWDGHLSTVEFAAKIQKV